MCYSQVRRRLLKTEGEKKQNHSRYLLLDNAEMTKHDLLNQLAKQDQTAVRHIDQGLSHNISKQLTSQQSLTQFIYD